ncbi:ADP-ribosylation factor family protein, partial [Diplocarpon rosae]
STPYLSLVSGQGRPGFYSVASRTIHTFTRARIPVEALHEDTDDFRAWATGLYCLSRSLFTISKLYRRHRTREMYHLAKGLYLYATSKEEYSVLLLGLDNAGKTTFHEQVKALFLPSYPNPKLKTVPTVGQNVSTITMPDMYLKIWDVGGQHSLRKLWQSYYNSCHAIVFIIDSTDIGDGNLEHDDSGRLEECKLVLEDVLQHSETEGVPLLVLANKQDREDCVEVVRIKEGLVKKVFEGEKGASIRDSRVLPVSALTGTGVKEAVEWVRSRVKWNKEGRPPVMR